KLLTAAAGAPTLTIAQINGEPGVGKTSLAIHVAHQVHLAFPDGHLFLALNGSSTSPRDPLPVLGEILRTLGVAPADLPDTLTDPAEMYRGLLANKRMLVVADDVAGPDQIKWLLPGSPACALVVTSRTRPLGLAGAHVIDLERLTNDESRALLRAIIGE